jgi:hypothetical protein
MHAGFFSIIPFRALISRRRHKSPAQKLSSIPATCYNSIATMVPGMFPDAIQ